VRITSIPSQRKTSSKARLNFVSRSWTSSPELLLTLAQLHDEIPGLLCDPGAVAVDCAGAELKPAGCERDEEKHVDPLQHERLDRKEIAGERARRLPAQERPPRLLAALGCG
jgi:hypothetical protein